MIALKNNNINKLLCLFIKYLFLIALLPKTLQMLIFTVFVFFIFIKEKKIYVNKLFFPLFLYCMIYCLSIIFNAGGIDTDRLLASFNTLSIWVSGIFISSFLINKKIEIEKIQKYFFINQLILSILALSSVLLTVLNINNIEILGRSLFVADWSEGTRSTRLSAFFEYPNLIPIFSFLSFPFSLSFLKKKSPLIQFLFLILFILPIIMSKSRIALMLLPLLIIWFFLKDSSKNKEKKILVIVIILLLTILNFQKISSFTNKIIGYRQGSTNTRSDIYQKSIEKTVKDSPMLGLGIKTMLGNYPLGSHSTYIGAFYKTGFIGFFFFILWIMIIIFSILETRQRTNLYLAPFFLIFLIATLEDIDGSNWSGILFFVILGIILSSSKTKKPLKDPI